ncbi:S41 family peptidase [Colwellia sp. 1_MG-2023]|uniref:S41 family peptidase n=1 Tax=Colwellia sp. 1_MG-2023 TaxID=3062649 RepID=UPI0026E4050F|nr:S41 family peptidase [Colwellia sp. 1_MG-2023]MDO6447034.1 S41 family peptidase [Colwellia sp. 1_MG-2023]
MKSKFIIGLVFISSIAFAQNTRKEQWQSDLALYQQALESNHIDLYHQIDKPSFESKLNTISESIEELSDWEVALKLMRLTRKIGDGHTAVSFANWQTPTFPISVKKISNKWRVVKVSTDKKELLGARLESIDGINIDEIERKLSNVAQYVENSHSEVVRIGNYMPISELLYALKITQSSQEAVFGLVTAEGKKLSLTLKALLNSEIAQQRFEHLSIHSSAVEKPKNTDFDYLWYTNIEDTKATYIRFDNYPSFEEMVGFVEKLIEFTTQNQSQQLIIDLRNNGGGDLYIGLVLANALNLVDSIDWKNGVYVLTSGVTFSAGASNAALFRQLLNAQVVGTPTGSNPTGYQDMGEFVLPNSKLRITYSKRLFRIQEVITEGVQPDKLIKHDWESYSLGVDNVLNEVIEKLTQPHES